MCDELCQPTDTEAGRDDDYVLPHQRIWTFHVHSLSTDGDRAFTVEQSFITRHCCHRLFPSSAVVLNHISSHFLIPGQVKSSQVK